MASRRKADIVIGVDFGMTCTGVAYSLGPHWPDPKTIQRWPGKLGNEIRNKVETAISYDLRTGHQSSWGFLCNPDDDRYEYNSLFKLYLDAHHQDATPNPPSLAEVQRWYEDYLRCLYGYIMKYFQETIPRFASSRVDFVFSVPVTWRQNAGLLAEIERIIRAAGFGSREQETASIYLTEAEAAAIYASKQSMARGEVFLVVDAGGGTTDLNILRVESTARNQVELMPLSWTEGMAIGSTLIDYKVRIWIEERLSMIREHLPAAVEATATQIMQDRFDTFKCSFGSPGMDVPKLLLAIPGLRAGLDVPHASVEDSKMVITRQELQDLFDAQIDKMCVLINQQIRLLRERHPGETISYLVLSGGLGSSPYVQSRIRASPYPNFPYPKPNQPFPQNSQLAVVHGLVAARIQSNRGGPEIYAQRCSPLSYGILCRELYDPIKHINETVVQDPYDKKRWAERQIHWAIKQGDIVQADTGICQPYQIKLDMGKEVQPWRTYVVMSSLPARQLPQSMKREGARVICAVETKLRSTDMKRKNRHWYDLGREYNRATLVVQMLVGVGLRFQILVGEEVRSRDHGEIEVEWESADANHTKMFDKDRQVLEMFRT
ncbi:hypothetical protein LTR62_004227 [Meristemomyces frigidus]|uniref:Uncharacterized protein n=1 Tax=Meristemomyces frigidus TaxID=1508187 RepID=A0AAN7YK45_9PEZI|nr:hypothetical protein LTR62_004227 [Meristemomyces frigidus]